MANKLTASDLKNHTRFSAAQLAAMVGCKVLHRGDMNAEIVDARFALQMIRIRMSNGNECIIHPLELG